MDVAKEMTHRNSAAFGLAPATAAGFAVVVAAARSSSVAVRILAQLTGLPAVGRCFAAVAVAAAKVRQTDY